MAPTTLEQDVYTNKINLLTARNQRLLASWLPPEPKHQSSATTQAEEELGNDEDEGFGTPMPELFGLGAKLPIDADVKREELSSNDRLRKQLLGNDAFKRHQKETRAKSRVGTALMPVRAKPRPMKGVKRGLDDDSEEDEGRSRLGKSRHDAKKRKPEPHSEPDAELEENATADVTQAGLGPTKSAVSLPKGNSYLDEILADRSQKKSKKNKKKRKKQRLAIEGVGASA